jgi:hypothetical protein
MKRTSHFGHFQLVLARERFKAHTFEAGAFE